MKQTMMNQESQSVISKEAAEDCVYPAVVLNDPEHSPFSTNHIEWRSMNVFTRTNRRYKHNTVVSIVNNIHTLPNVVWSLSVNQHSAVSR
jgi:hypothetical protein